MRNLRNTKYLFIKKRIRFAKQKNIVVILLICYSPRWNEKHKNTRSHILRTFLEPMFKSIASTTITWLRKYICYLLSYAWQHNTTTSHWLSQNCPRLQPTHPTLSSADLMLIPRRPYYYCLPRTRRNCWRRLVTHCRPASLFACCTQADCAWTVVRSRTPGWDSRAGRVWGRVAFQQVAGEPAAGLPIRFFSKRIIARQSK